MAEGDREQVLARAKQFLRDAKKLYIEDRPIDSRRLEQQAAEVAREQARQLVASAVQEGDERGALVVHGRTLARLLKDLNDHGTARRVLARVLEHAAADVAASQLLALCTYKDEELPPDVRFADALAILDAIGLRDPLCDDPETLGQGGAIYKRRWERTGRIEELHTSLYFYRKGWQSNPQKDQGYCGVNAAFLLDLLSHRARTAALRESASTIYADELAEEAQQLRLDMLARVPSSVANDAGASSQYWYLVTMAEITFGLQDWPAAQAWLAKARLAEHSEWERQTTAKQLVSLARMRGLMPPLTGDPAQAEPPWRALHALLGKDALAAFDSYRGKVGLALSGGGFRASLFHLGVLARLAECDVLRSVEVLSTVSGGSILGAHYYLALRHRLETMQDRELDRDSYIAMVRELIDQFCAGVQRNLRVRVFASLRANFRMLWPFGGYGRSNRIGELYDEYLYAAVPDGLERPRKMRDLLVKPLVSNAGELRPDESFKPKFSNWRRRAKVPILLLNTTSLNSGHNWHFTASWMGEPPGLMGQEVDMNERYRRLYYGQAPSERLRDFPLAYAVAASAGVPALFDPLVLEKLYPERTLRLVDGGVHDNQGVAGLLDESCSVILCSDASGQMDDQNSPASNELGVFFRSDSILQDRLREAQYQDLAWRLQSNALQGLFFIHLKEELESDPIGWIDCQDPSAPIDRPSATSYRVDRTIQRLLAEVRTDLDTFTEVEAYALMASGYLMTTRKLEHLDKLHGESGLPGEWSGFNVRAPARDDWQFQPIVPIIATPSSSGSRARDLARQLEASRMLFGKVWVLVPVLTALAITVGVFALIAAGWWTWEHRNEVFTLRFDFGIGKIAIAAILSVVALLIPLGRYIKRLGDLRRWLYVLALVIAGSLLSHLHLQIFDRIYKWRGGLKRLLSLPG